MFKTFSVSQGEEMVCHAQFRYLGTGGIYDIQIRLGYRDGKEFIPEEWLEWTLEEVVIPKLGINRFEITCPISPNAPPEMYDAEFSARIPDLPFPENREVVFYMDNAIRITQTVITETVEEI